MILMYMVMALIWWWGTVVVWHVLMSIVAMVAGGSYNIDVWGIVIGIIAAFWPFYIPELLGLIGKLLKKD